MKKLTVLLFIAVYMGSSLDLNAQAGRSNPKNSKKANRRPEEPKKPEFINNDVIDDSIETDDDVINVDTELVSVPVRVMDRQGRFIRGLKKEDFSVFEDKTPQDIEYFSNEQKPFTVALVLDMSYSSTFKINEIQQAALTFISELRPQDRVMVVSFDETVKVLCEPTNNRKTIEQAIIKTQIASGTSLYQTIDYVVNYRLNKINGRKAIVLFSDGVDTTSRNATYEKNLRDVSESDSLVYPIHYDTYADVQKIKNGQVIVQDPQIKTTPTANGGSIPTGRTTPKLPIPFPLPTGTIGGGGRQTRSIPDGSGTSKEEYIRAEKYVDQMAKNTGGRVYQATNFSTLTRAFSQIASELREFYSLGYYPNDEKGEGIKRRIKVKVNRKNVAVKSRSSYISRKKKASKK